MQFIIQRFLFAKNLAKTIHAPVRQCNYANNYYGDQVCIARQHKDWIKNAEFIQSD